jgi:hypothetical protein
MRSWPALLIAPLLLLAQQSVALALATPSCRNQTTVAMHAVSAIALLAILLLTALAGSAWRAHRLVHDASFASPRREDTRALRRARFVAALAVVVGLLSALVSLAMWLPIWVLSPCVD